MYSPDGFASLACALQEQCFFLTYQQPFIQLMHLINKNIYLFFGLQALIWFTLIGIIYFIAKEMKLKHLFITPIIILYGTTFFVDNFIGSFENDAIGIILILLSILFYYKQKNKEKTIDKIIFTGLSLWFIELSLTYWLWIGYIFRPIILNSNIVEVMFWTHWLSYLFLLPIIILIIIQALNKIEKRPNLLIITILIIPKLFIFGLPIIMRFLDEIITKLLEQDKKFWITIIVIGLITGQLCRVGLYTSNSWNRVIEDEQCVTVDDEYYLRATKGLNYSYNQIDMTGVEKCKQET